MYRGGLTSIVKLQMIRFYHFVLYLFNTPVSDKDRIIGDEDMGPYTAFVVAVLPL